MLIAVKYSKSSSLMSHEKYPAMKMRQGWVKYRTTLVLSTNKEPQKVAVVMLTQEKKCFFRFLDQWQNLCQVARSCSYLLFLAEIKKTAIAEREGIRFSSFFFFSKKIFLFRMFKLELLFLLSFPLFFLASERPSWRRGSSNETR